MFYLQYQIHAGVIVFVFCYRFETDIVRPDKSMNR